MIFHEYYSKLDPAVIDRFVLAQEMGRLITVGADGMPHVGLYPFVYEQGRLDLHLVRADELMADLRQRPRCVFEVDEVLGVIPSYWVHPQYAGSATAYHRTVIFDCAATVIEDPAAVAGQQVRLLARYQPEGGFRPLATDDPLYQGALAQLAAVRLGILQTRAKFKLGQNRPAEARRKVIAELRKRGRPNDARAADALEWTLGQAGAGPDGAAS
ncbi:MAG: FMN-binding negative transcriptional regulator [Candidatus Rokuibacteriota bacterium]